MSAEAPEPQDPQGVAGESQVCTRSEGRVLRVTLNRPQALNALSHDMIGALRAVLHQAVSESAEYSAIWLEGAGDRAFCGGGDVKQLSQGTFAEQLLFLGDEYRLDLALATSAIPVVSVMSGIAMGGGIGIGGHVTNRIVTESSKLGMPEARIGIVPDVGGALLLARSPGRLGELLAITAGVMTAGDAVALGFADHFVSQANMSILRHSLSAGVPVSEALAAVADQAPESKMMASRSWWDHLADAALGSAESVLRSPASAARRLLSAMEQSPHREARDAAVLARQMSPVSVAVSLAQISRVRLLQQSLPEVLADDYRVLGRLLRRADFGEGVRAQLLDRDGAPKWSPAHLDQVSDAEVLRVCDPALRPDECAWQSSI